MNENVENKNLSETEVKEQKNYWPHILIACTIIILLIVLGKWITYSRYTVKDFKQDITYLTGDEYPVVWLFKSKSNLTGSKITVEAQVITHDELNFYDETKWYNGTAYVTITDGVVTYFRIAEQLYVNGDYVYGDFRK